MDKMEVIVGILGTAAVTIATILGNHFLALYRDVKKADRELLEKRLNATLENTVQLGVLSDKIQRILEDTKSIPKIKEDLNGLHQWRKNHIKEHKEETDEDDGH